MRKFKLTMTICFLLSMKSMSQRAEVPVQPPIPVEILAGHRAFSYQHVINKNLRGEKFSFFNVTSFDADYDRNEDNVFLISGFFSYSLGKGFSAGLGGEIQRPGAFVIAGAQYAYVSNQLLIVVFPSVNLNGDTQYSQLNLLEYRPNISRSLRGYFRAQILIITDFNVYNRGYQQVRLGLQIKQTQIGLAATFDQFDSGTIATTNYGAFVRLLVF